MPIASWGLAPALAAGNTVVLKPAELTPLTAMRLGELALEAGIPSGVLTVIPGRGSVVGERFVTHPAVRKVCFTGSTRVGKQVMRGAANHVKRVTLELGGKSANLVFDDADLEIAAASAPAAVFDNAGQDCCARSRILVQHSVFERFMGLLEPAVTAVAVGNPALESSHMGPLISESQRAAVRSFIEDAPEDVEVAFRGAAPQGAGYWYPATVVLPTSTSDRVWRDEVFGPVVAVMPFEDEADAVAKAHDTAYGLSGSIGPGTWAARCVSRAAWRRATSRSTPTAASGTRRRLGVQAVRHRPRARARRARRLHRREKRLHLDRPVTVRTRKAPP